MLTWKKQQILFWLMVMSDSIIRSYFFIKYFNFFVSRNNWQQSFVVDRQQSKGSVARDRSGGRLTVAVDVIHLQCGCHGLVNVNNDSNWEDSTFMVQSR